MFGDGSVRTVYTPGHTLGHMSVVLRTARGEVLVAADAIYMRRTLEDTTSPTAPRTSTCSGARCARSASTATETPEALIVPGHDWEAWQKLEAVY